MRGRPVSRILLLDGPKPALRRPFLCAVHCCTALAANPAPSGQGGPVRERTRGPYLALLPVGLAMRALLPAPRWALTPPFHPDPPWHPLETLGHDGRSVFCGAFRQVALPGRYPAPMPWRVRTFLSGGLRPQSGRPAFRARAAIGRRRAPVKRIRAVGVNAAGQKSRQGTLPPGPGSPHRGMGPGAHGTGDPCGPRAGGERRPGRGRTKRRGPGTVRHHRACPCAAPTDRDARRRQRRCTSQSAARAIFSACRESALRGQTSASHALRRAPVPYTFQSARQRPREANSQCAHR